MASSETEMSLGATLAYSTTAGGAYTSLGGIQSFDRGTDVGFADVSGLDDTKTVKKPKRLNPGQLNFQVLFRKTQHAALYTHFLARTQLYWKITNAGGSVAANLFGHMASLKKSYPNDEPVMTDITIELSGDGTSAETFTP